MSFVQLNVKVTVNQLISTIMKIFTIILYLRKFSSHLQHCLTEKNVVISMATTD